MRNNHGLLHTHVNTKTGHWYREHEDIGVGGQIDSFYEYLYKAWALFGDEEYFSMWDEVYNSISEKLRCPDTHLFFDFSLQGGLSKKAQSLSCFFPGLEAHWGKVERANQTVHTLFKVWQENQFMPEIFQKEINPLGEVTFRPLLQEYPLRPEFVESIYFLYRKTKDKELLNMAVEVVKSLRKTKEKCGYAAVYRTSPSIVLRDRMDSFFLSETLKYLYLIFDDENVFNHLPGVVFNTEAHIFFKDI